MLACLRDTADLGLGHTNVQTEKIELKMYVDSSHANGKSRRSIYGYALFSNDAILCYKNKPNPLVTLSTTEFEFIAVALPIREFKWIQNMLQELKIKIHVATIFSDNQGAIRILQHRSAQGRTKHLDIKSQCLKQAILKRKIKTRYVKSEGSIADLFTKPLRRLSFQRLRSTSARIKGRLLNPIL